MRQESRSGFVTFAPCFPSRRFIFGLNQLQTYENIEPVPAYGPHEQKDIRIVTHVSEGSAILLPCVD